MRWSFFSFKMALEILNISYCRYMRIMRADMVGFPKHSSFTPHGFPQVLAKRMKLL